MHKTNAWRDIMLGDMGILILLALVRIIFHVLTDGQYGFHRDELTTLDDARFLAWGYVAYPPVTPFIGRIALELFGQSLVGVRLFSAVAQGITLVFAGLMARELGGNRWAQILAGLAILVAPVSLAQGALFQYVSFDYLWWVLLAYLMICLLKSENPRWWLGIGIVIGLGMLTKYTMAFFAAGIVGGVLLTPARQYLKNRWLWIGVALTFLVFLPNLVWQVQHDFISLAHLSGIHAHDISIGRADDFLIQQLLIGANFMTIPLWIAGLGFYFFAPSGKRYRLIGWMFVIPLALFIVAQGRSYYLAPAYPMLLASGAVVFERWLATLTLGWSRLIRGIAWTALIIGGGLMGAVTLPLAPVNSAWWDVASGVLPDLKEEIGWQELAETTASIRNALPVAEQARVGILTQNYGEAGAINLYGPNYKLPQAISGVNSYWLRGYGDPPPQTLIVIGFQREWIAQDFASCELAGHITNRYNIQNEESKVPGIFVCRGLRKPWTEFWKQLQHFG
jgi:4-amino-4-deoxy-L-arabinose transferase-like glycosyltransferase